MSGGLYLDFEGKCNAINGHFRFFFYLYPAAFRIRGFYAGYHHVVLLRNRAGLTYTNTEILPANLHPCLGWASFVFVKLSAYTLPLARHVLGNPNDV